ncbi:relaxase/mobilization nuclease domain-containing protein [Rubrivirga sp. S365]|uniref:relaxase/mobilization nuclease domain-containing protein n=1 Tax=Rubrivirga sp. S365 TaxID=3076080 RepID=UPI0028C53DF2|nr:relaxase/mobilization nuclease domain-containing protein [Rubrivirga sp. S365]MDT7858193.1 relaxase/mobilization nuclease domain-containing protein [Rubrivirga sp. S365]
MAGDPDRVEWAETRNMAAGRDWSDGAGPAPFTPREVAAEMDRRAGAERTDRPAYHVAIAFDPDDRPTDAELRAAVDRTLRDLGLEKHQALVVRHNDADHAHVHVMVNRVGEDRAVWSPWRDRVKLRASMEAQERELGVRWTGRNRGLERAPDRADADRPGEGRAPAPVPAARTPTDGRGFAHEVRAAALAELKGAKTWGEVDAALAARGWRVERRGQGAVVTDGAREAKLSSVSRTVGRSRLEARLGPLRDHERGRPPSPEKAPAPPRPRGGPGRPRTAARAPSAQVRVRRAFAEAVRPAREAGRTAWDDVRASAAARSWGRRAEVLAGEASGAGRAFGRALRTAYADPGEARAAFWRAVREGGPEAAAKTMAERPEAFGPLRETERAGGLVRGTKQPAQTAAAEAGRVGGAYVLARDRADAAAQVAQVMEARSEGTSTLDRLAVRASESRAFARFVEDHGGLSGVQAGADVVRERAAQALEARAEGTARALEGEVRGNARAFGRALRTAYADPGEARAAFWRAVREGGPEAAAKTMAERPEAFGPLRETERARAAAGEAGPAGVAYVRARGRAGDVVREASALGRERGEANWAFNHALGTAYVERGPARAAFERAARRDGPEAAAAAMAERPEAFGPLRETGGARAAAGEAGRAGAVYLDVRGRSEAAGRVAQALQDGPRGRPSAALTPHGPGASTPGAAHSAPARARSGGRTGRAGLRVGQAAVRTLGREGEPEADPGRVALGAARTLAAARAGGPRTGGRRAPLAGRTLQARAVHRDVRPGGRVDRLAVLVAEHRALRRIEAAHSAPARVQSAVLAVRARAAQVLTVDEKHARGAFGRALASVYDEPSEAWAAFGRAVREGGPDAAAKTLAERPEAFGPLRPTETKRAFGLLKAETTEPARAASPEAARAGAAHVSLSDRKEAAVGAARALRTELVRADPALAAARAREAPGVQAVVARAERARDALSPAAGPSRGRWRPAEVERAIGRLAERVGRPVRAKTTPGRSADPGGGHRGGHGLTGRSGRAPDAKGAPKGKGTPTRVQRALEARVGAAGLKAVARAVRAIDRGRGRE